jgi:dTDP-4-dehydrorhamnose reductase
VNRYGASKLAGEAAVAAAHPQALILRTNFFTWPTPEKVGLAGWFLGRLEAGQACPGFVDARFNPLPAGLLVGILLELVAGESAGVLHVAGGSCITKHEFGVRLAECFGLDAGLVRAVSSDTGGLTATRGKNLCLNTTKAERLLGRHMPSLEESLRHFRMEKENGFSEGLMAIRQEVPGIM